MNALERNTPARLAQGASPDENVVPHPHQRPLPLRGRRRPRPRRGDVPVAAQVRRRHRPVRRPGDAQGPTGGKQFGYIILPDRHPVRDDAGGGAQGQQALRRGLGGPPGAARARRALRRDGQPDRAVQGARRQDQRHRRRRRRATATASRAQLDLVFRDLDELARRDLRQDRPEGRRARVLDRLGQGRRRHRRPQITRITRAPRRPETTGVRDEFDELPRRPARQPQRRHHRDRRDRDARPAPHHPPGLRRALRRLRLRRHTTPSPRRWSGCSPPSTSTTSTPRTQTLEKFYDSVRTRGRGRRQRRGPAADHRRALRHVLRDRLQEDRRQARHRLHPGRDRRLHPALRRRGAARRSSARASPTRACTSSTASPAPAPSWSGCSSRASSSRTTSPASTPKSCTPTRSCCSPTTSPPSTSRPPTRTSPRRLAERRDYEPFPGLSSPTPSSPGRTTTGPTSTSSPRTTSGSSGSRSCRSRSSSATRPTRRARTRPTTTTPNEKYPSLDEAIRTTYADRSTATLQELALRLLHPRDQVGDAADQGPRRHRLSSPTAASSTPTRADGMRKTLAEEFSAPSTSSISGEHAHPRTGASRGWPDLRGRAVKPRWRSRCWYETPPSPARRRSTTPTSATTSREQKLAPTCCRRPPRCRKPR